MSTKNCKIDVVSIRVKQKDATALKMNFKDILKHPEILGKEKPISNKIVQYSVLEENEKYIIGFIRTILDKDLPAKIDKKTKEISKLDVKEGEGLAFGNIFLYSIELNCLFYEVNKNSIYLNAFKEYIYKCYRDSESLKSTGGFAIDFGTIYRKKEYDRAIKMRSYKSFILKVHQPSKLLETINQLNQSLEEKIENDFLPQLEQASKLNSEIAEIEFKVSRPKKTGGLAQDIIIPILGRLNKFLGYGQIREYVDKVEVCGYTIDSEAKTPIDLLGDIYFASFKIDIPRLDSNLQITERKENIKLLFEREYPILNEYIWFQMIILRK